ncbi:bifunctional hydroxymethylpyrimidine kinase/phosphomethylpyrimidine kinase [Rhizobiaceae sp. 2RAB30]
MAVTPHVLVVAGSDSSGGAGIARDIETIAAFGLRACLAVTAVTVQTHEAVETVELMAPDLVAAQMRAALAANPVAAIKIGMLGTEAAVRVVAEVFEDHQGLPIILDPVLASTSGRALLSKGAVAVLRQKLMPLCRLVTPNLPELALLTGSSQAVNDSEIQHQSRLLLDAGASALLVKGGHASGETSTDLLFRRGEPLFRFDAPRLKASMRGTGCMLSSAIAAQLATGQTIGEAVECAKRHVFDALRGQISSPR